MYGDPAIRKSGYTQRELAKRLHMSDAEFTKKKNGWRGMKFSPEDIQTLAFYGVAVDELYPHDTPNPEAAKS